MTNFEQSIIKSKSNKFFSYYDLDAFIALLTLKNMKRHQILMSKHSINISFPNGRFKRPMNRSEFIIDETKFFLKDFKCIFLQEICTVFGRVDLYVIIHEKEYDINKFISLVYDYYKRTFHSYSVKRDSLITSVNLSLKGLYKIMKHIIREEQREVYLYFEKFGSKYIIKDRSELKTILNSRFSILSLTPVLFEIFEFDLTKNISKKYISENSYFTQIFLKKGNFSNKNYFEKKFTSPIYSYNVLNDERYTDYYGSSGNISISSNNIIVNKINLYNPMMKNILDGLLGKSEIYNKKFLHECLYKLHDIRLTYAFRSYHKYQKIMIFNLRKNLSEYKSYRHFFRCEFRFRMNNKLRNYSEISDLEIKNIFRIFKVFNSKKLTSIKLFKVKNYVRLFKRTLNTLELYTDKLSYNLKSVAQKIFGNLIFFEFYIRGGKEFHYLPLNQDQKNILRRNMQFATVMDEYENILSSHRFNIELIKKYIKTAKIDQNLYSQYTIIMNSFVETNTSTWQVKIMELFISLTIAHYNITYETIIGESDNRILTDVKEKTPEFFISSILYYGVANYKRNISNIYYSNVIYILRMISSIRGNRNFNISQYTSLNRISQLNIPYAKDSEGEILYIRIILYDQLSSTQFKLEIVNEMSKKILEVNALSGKSDRFQFTMQKKKIFSYLKYVKQLSNLKIRNDTSTPFWIIFLIRSRLFYLARCEEISRFDWNVEEVPFIFNESANFLDFIEREVIFSKRIKIQGNEEFISLIYFLRTLNDPSYVLNDSEVILHRRNLRNLKFEEKDNILPNRNTIVNQVEISRNIKIFFIEQCSDFIINLRKIPNNNRIFYTADLIDYVGLSMKVERIPDNMNMAVFVNEIMGLECFSSLIEIDRMPDENFRFYLRVNS